MNQTLSGLFRRDYLAERAVRIPEKAVLVGRVSLSSQVEGLLQPEVGDLIFPMSNAFFELAVRPCTPSSARLLQERIHKFTNIIALPCHLGHDSRGC